MSSSSGNPSDTFVTLRRRAAEGYVLAWQCGHLELGIETKEKNSPYLALGKAFGIAVIADRLGVLLGSGLR